MSQLRAIYRFWDIRNLKVETGPLRHVISAVTPPPPPPKTPRDVLEMSWTRARSLLVCILQKFFEFYLSKEGQSSRFPS